MAILIFGNTKGNPPTLFRTLHHGSGTVDAYSLGVDSSGNFYPVMDTPDGTGLAKYSNDGTLLWQRNLTGSTTVSSMTDPNGNTYVFNGTIAKYNTSGSLVWQRYPDISSIVGGIYASSTYVAATIQNNANDRTRLLVYNTATGGAWTNRELTNTEDPGTVAIDSSGNIITGGRLAGGGMFVCKRNATGTFQWVQTKVGINGEAVATDDSDNVYLLGNISSGPIGSNDWFLVKYNTSGVEQYQKAFGGTGNDFGADSLTFDGAGNIYAAGTSNVGGTNKITVFKMNTAGTLQWANAFNGSSNGDIKVVADSSNVYVIGDGTSSNAVIAKLPADGTGTGTYGAYTYETTTQSLVTATQSASGTTPANSNTSTTTTAGSETDSAGNLVNTDQ